MSNDEKIIKSRQQQKHDISTNWEKAVNFIPLVGEFIVYDDLKKMKLGDGVTKVNDLEFFSGDFSIGNNLTGLKGYYWHNLEVDNSTETPSYLLTLSSTQMELTPVSCGFVATDILSISDGSNAMVDVCNILEVIDDTTIRVDSIPEFVDDQRATYSDWYPYNYAVWCLNKPNVGVIDLNAGSFVQGENNEARGWGTSATGHLTKAIGMTASAEGLRTVASGERSHAEGSDTQALASCSHAEGYKTIASGAQSHAEGCSTIASGEYSHVEGYQNEASGKDSHAEGRATIAKGVRAHAEGWHTTALGENQHIEGQYNIEDTGTNTKTQTKKGQFIHIAGNGTSKAPSNAYTLDWDGNAWFAGDVKVGKNGYKLVNERETVGQIGAYHYNSSLWNYGEIFNDYENNVVGPCAHAEGSSTTAYGLYAHAEGNYTEANGDASHAEGRETATWYGYPNAHAEGYQSKAFGPYSHAEGGATRTEGEGAHAEGYLTEAIGQNAHSEGRATQALGGKSHAEGWNTIASEECQHVQGKYNVVDENNFAGNYAHVVGNGTSKTKRSNAHTLDWDGNAWFAGKITVGKNKDELATKVYVDTNNVGKTSIGEDGKVLGEIFNDYSNNIASGENSHAEGLGTKAEGNHSHAEGYETHAQGENSHAEGRGAWARGNNSHAEGSGTESTGENSHAEGCNAIAAGWHSHAEGCGTIASGHYQHVQGKYNVIDHENKYAHIVGNGADETVLSNAHTIDWSGNAWFAGNIYIGGTSQEDAVSIDNLELITIDDIDTICSSTIEYVSLSEGAF